MKTTKEILATLGSYKARAAEAYGIISLGIFGSTARGEQHEGSDVDVCFAARTVPTLPMLVRLKRELEDLLGMPVDLVRLRDRMDEYLRREIQKDALYV